jgi:hypothetical protein
MLRNGSSPAKFEGAADDGRWSGMRCVGEWFSLIFLISYHHHQEHPVVRHVTPTVRLLRWLHASCSELLRVADR